MWGDTRKPATMYPNTNGCLSFLNRSVTNPATTRIRARSFTNSGSSDINLLWS